MAVIDYYGIEEAIKSVIDAELSGNFICLVEQEIMLDPDRSFIGIYLNRRDAPADIQTMSAGQRTRYDLTVSIWVYTMALEVALAAEIRDDLIGNLERELMEHRSTINGGDFFIQGGEFQSAKDDEGEFFVLGAETVLVLQADSQV